MQPLDVLPSLRALAETIVVFTLARNVELNSAPKKLLAIGGGPTHIGFGMRFLRTRLRVS